MEALSTGLTWNDIEAKFAEDSEYVFSLELRNRRANLGLRKKGKINEGKVWRLIIQRDYKNYKKTILRYNIKTDDENLKSEAVSDKMVTKLNNLLGL